uniref:Ig-like domain-containing protein n=1 Tax=Leptobrachium leishanense TaxID=445787 RepID=A0A8C5LR28_9ANUR
MHVPHLMHFRITLIIFVCANKVTADAALLGKDTILDCNYKENSTILVFWGIQFQDASRCHISYEPSSTNTSSNCSERMRPQGTSLHLSDSQASDDGMYVCDVIHTTGISHTEIHLEVLVQPYVILTVNSQSYPECQAIGGKPPANISWSPESEYVKPERKLLANKTWVTTSTYTNENFHGSALTCVVSHPTFSEKRFLTIRGNGGSFPLWAGLVTGISVISCVILGTLIFWQRTNIRRCIRGDKQNNPTVGQQSNPVRERNLGMVRRKPHFIQHAKATLSSCYYSVTNTSSSYT